MACGCKDCSGGGHYLFELLPEQIESLKLLDGNVIMSGVDLPRRTVMIAKTELETALAALNLELVAKEPWDQDSDYYVAFLQPKGTTGPQLFFAESSGSDQYDKELFGILERALLASLNTSLVVYFANGESRAPKRDSLWRFFVNAHTGYVDNKVERLPSEIFGYEVARKVIVPVDGYRSALSAWGNFKLDTEKLKTS